MSGLPNAQSAYVVHPKVTRYLLDLTNQDGRGKAIFCLRRGFALERWEELAEALVRLAQEHEVVRTMDSDEGVKYVVEGSMTTPDGRIANLRTIWMIGHGETAPRLVTAYPLD